MFVYVLFCVIRIKRQKNLTFILKQRLILSSVVLQVRVGSHQEAISDDLLFLLVATRSHSITWPIVCVFSISTRPHDTDTVAFSNLSTLEIVFESLRFHRKRYTVFIVFVWTGHENATTGAFSIQCGVWITYRQSHCASLRRSRTKPRYIVLYRGLVRMRSRLHCAGEVRLSFWHWRIQNCHSNLCEQKIN